MAPWNGGFVWSEKRGKPWIGVACEHLGASSWWPCKDHLSEEPDSMTINIQSPSKLQAVANGNLRSTKIIDDKYTNYEWFVSYPINSYCVTFYIGNFVNFNETFSNKGHEYQLDYYVLPHNLEKAKKYYEQTKEVLEVFEGLYGTYPAPKDGVGMVEAPYSGMEHQSAIAIGDNYGSKSNRSYGNKLYDYLLVHETAHEWWGNAVTMNDMADAWISEGFATYSEYLFLEQKYGHDEYLNAVESGMQGIHNIWPIVGERNVNDNTFLGGDIYTKGAVTLHNYRCLLSNDSLFFAVIKGFYNEYKYKTVTTPEFISFVNTYTGHNYSSFFKKFLYDVLPPILEYNFTTGNDSLYFTYGWTGVKEDFEMPISITTDDGTNYRLLATTKRNVFAMKGKSFFLANERSTEKKKLAPNSFTYYWTRWVH